MADRWPIDIPARDLWSCVACGRRLDSSVEQASVNHRIQGNRKDRRPSNGVLMCGTGITGCHGSAGGTGRAEGGRLGYMVSRHCPREWTTRIPVFYNQPNMGRRGWCLLDDAGGVHATRYTDPGLDAFTLSVELDPEGSW